ncbi:MAG: hypothetical protein Q4C44_02535 [bacterium]|nr:hypothetical protein [bacterium]
MNKVPNIISTKDLDYLSDMFNWNYGAYKSCINMLEEITDQKLCNLASKCAKLFATNMDNVLNILESGEANE